MGTSKLQGSRWLLTSCLALNRRLVLTLGQRVEVEGAGPLKGFLEFAYLLNDTKIKNGVAGR